MMKKMQFAMSLAAMLCSMTAMTLTAAPKDGSITSFFGTSRDYSTYMMGQSYPMLASAEKPKIEGMTVVQIVSTDPSFSTLAKGLKATDLNKTLEGKGPFTIFAPSDAAFAKLSPNTLSDLFKPENKEKFTAILTYHVVPEKALKAEEIKEGQIETVNGKKLDVKVKGSEVTVNNAKVIKTNIVGSNGVIHEIDAVILP